MRSFTLSFLPALALSLSLTSPAIAAPDELQASPMMHEDKQIGCQLTFGHSQADPANFGKGEALVEGSLNFLKFDQNMIFALKLGVTGSNGSSRTSPFEANFVDGDAPNTASLMSKMDSDNQGYRLFAFKPDDATISATISRPGKERIVRLSYRLKEGGPATQVAISIDSDPARQAFLGWLDCIEGMTK
jgi:hypothetical protein